MQVESLRNPAKPKTPFIPVATFFAEAATQVKSHRAFWRRRVKAEGRIQKSEFSVNGRRAFLFINIL
jgi:hypothetical protein